MPRTDRMTAERFDELRRTLTVKGIPLIDAPDDDLAAEWEAGMYLDAAKGLTPEQNERHIAVERELFDHRPNPTGEDA